MKLFIKHKKYRDICWRVLTQYQGTGYIKFKVELWNQGYVHSWPLPIKEYLDITREDVSNWLWTEQENNECLRYSDWKELETET